MLQVFERRKLNSFTKLVKISVNQKQEPYKINIGGQSMFGNHSKTYDMDKIEWKPSEKMIMSEGEISLSVSDSPSSVTPVKENEGT